jgi:dTMP kinase
MFIVIEGIDGSGKSTQSRILKEKLPDALLLREPGGTITGEKIRNLLLNPESLMGDRTEMLLFNAARAELHEEIINPALTAGKDVIMDRWAWSTFAYQGLRMPQEKIQEVVAFASMDVWPDLTVILDLPVEEALKRTHKHKDRIEQRSLDYHQSVRLQYQKLAMRYSFVVLDGSQEVQVIHEQILRAYNLRKQHARI